MAQIAPQRFAIRTRIDVERVQRAARSLAEALKFDRDQAEAVCLSVAELATNLQHYSRQGSILLSAPQTPVPGSILLESIDTGPGIPNVQRALEDGYSTGGSFGGGLGAVRRLMDEFSITSGPEGTCIVARKWRTRKS
jgi:serine/threonine-protein kinase RsbT